MVITLINRRNLKLIVPSMNWKALKGHSMNPYILLLSMLIDKGTIRARVNCMKMEHVDGRNAGNVVLYALSTCGWCGKTKELLKELKIAFDFVYVDLLPPEEMDEAIAIIEKYNPAGSFPTLILDNRKVIIGFREEEIRGAFGK
jgi:glutaredoxin-like protein NrdH